MLARDSMSSLQTNEKSADHILLCMVMLFGVILRFWHLQDIPLTHDELSALDRLRFTNFHDLIETGIKPDGHPAGVQVFLWFWTKIFGYSDVSLKLPFLLFGVGAIWLTYKLSIRWFHPTAAILSAAYMATLQFPVMYSQQARPYASGLFLGLWMIIAWYDLLTKDGNKIKQAVNYAIATTLCAYNHHFSLLLAGIVAITGLLLIQRNNVRYYFGAWVLAITLYLPHVGIFFHQLGQKGLLWLSRPGPDFFMEHAGFIFHFDLLVVIPFILIGLAGVVLIDHDPYGRKFRWISASWFLLPLLIGWAYSYFVQPVLQHNMLLFSFIFLIFLVVSLLPPQKKLVTALLTLCILTLNSWSLVHNREHYVLYYDQPFDHFSEVVRDFRESHPEQTLILLGEDPKYIDHYFLSENPDISYISVFNYGFSFEDLEKLLDSTSATYIITGNLPLSYIAEIRSRFPIEVIREYGFNYEINGFSTPEHHEEKLEDDILQTYRIDCSNNTFYQTDSISGICIANLSNGPSLLTDGVNLGKVIDDQHAIIDISVPFRGWAEQQDRLACYIDMPANNYQAEVRMQDFCGSDGDTSTWYTARLSVRLTHVIPWYKDLEDAKMIVRLEHTGMKSLEVQPIEISIRAGNPRLYGLFLPIHD